MCVHVYNRMVLCYICVHDQNVERRHQKAERRRKNEGKSESFYFVMRMMMMKIKLRFSDYISCSFPVTLDIQNYSLAKATKMMYFTYLVLLVFFGLWIVDTFFVGSLYVIVCMCVSVLLLFICMGDCYIKRYTHTSLTYECREWKL